MWITKEDLIKIAKEISEKQNTVNSMSMVCTSGWNIEDKIKFDAEYKFACDDLRVSQNKYDVALSKYAQQNIKDIF